MLGDVRLNEEDGFFRINAKGEIGSRGLNDLRVKVFGFLWLGNGMQICYKKIRGMHVLEFNPLFDRTKIIAEMYLARGLETTYHDLFGYMLFHRDTLS